MLIHAKVGSLCMNSAALSACGGLFPVSGGSVSPCFLQPCVVLVLAVAINALPQRGCETTSLLHLTVTRELDCLELALPTVDAVTERKETETRGDGRKVGLKFWSGHAPSGVRCPSHLIVL